MVHDWFRSPAWGPDDQVDFEARLARARKTSRAQYLRIKGLALDAAGHKEGARSLWLRVLEDADATHVMRWPTLEHLGNLDFDAAAALCLSQVNTARALLGPLHYS